jgi:hypothetical protein
MIFSSSSIWSDEPQPTIERGKEKRKTNAANEGIAKQHNQPETFCQECGGNPTSVSWEYKNPTEAIK